MRLLCPQSCFTCVAIAAFAAVVGAQSTAEGTLADGPKNQGSCSPSGSNSFLCSNGAFCTWDEPAAKFSCVGGTGEVDSEPAKGPPGRTCESHLDHFDCTGADGAEEICEIEGSVWVCQSLAAGGEGSGAPCIVHGGHTHGDCSGHCNNLDLGFYDLDMHIVSLFIVLIGSFLGAMLPIVASRQLRQPVIRWLFFIAKHFGTGIILSTAFIHLLYHSFVMFGNACLGELRFEPAASAISLAGVLVVFFSDFAMMRWMQSRHAAPAPKSIEGGAGSQEGSINADQVKDAPAVYDTAHTHAHGYTPDGAIDYSSPQAHFDVYLLEAGIIFHSIMIGVSLGASGGDQWQPLFIAIIFHQFFEGLALGARISLLQWPNGQNWHKWFMASAFGLITPIGIAIGIGVHASYNPNSGAALLAIGILDAVSAGVLLYAGIVELLVHDYMHGELARAKLGRVGVAIASLFAGAICMSVLGKWA